LRRRDNIKTLSLTRPKATSAGCLFDPRSVPQGEVLWGMTTLLRERAVRAARAFGATIAALCVATSAGAQPSAPEARVVTFAGAGGLELQGTLVLPPEPEQDGAKAPAVLLLPGSGPTDRDGNQRQFMLITDLLKQVADRLAAEGIATLRFDKRAVMTYAEHWPREAKELDAFFAFENFTGDAAAAYRYLRGHERIDAERVGLLGHSEGGLIALQLASDLAGGGEAPAAVILAGTAGRTLDAVVREQIAGALEKQTQDEAVREQYMEALEKATAAVKAREEVAADLPPGLAPLFNPTVLSLLHSYFTIDPAALAGKVTAPVLIIQGEKDVQISAERDTPLLRTALMSRTAGECEVLIVPGASHNLKVLSVEGDQGFAGPVAPEALEKIAVWSRQHLVRP
jgi:uncharacterized protein